MSDNNDPNVVLDAIPVDDSSRFVKAYSKISRRFKSLNFTGELLKSALSILSNQGVNAACKVFDCFGDNAEKVTSAFMKEYSKLQEKEIVLNKEERQSIINFITSDTNLSSKEKAELITKFNQYYIDEKHQRFERRLQTVMKIADDVAAVAGLFVLLTGGGKIATELGEQHADIKKQQIKYDAQVQKAQIKHDTAVQKAQIKADTKLKAKGK